MTDRELMQMALDALEKHVLEYETTEALRARLSQPEPEPVAWCIVENGRVHGLVKNKPAVMNAEKWQPLYTTPPQREWQGLTEEEIKDHWITCMWKIEGTALPIPEFARAIEAKLKEKNAL